MLTLVFAVGCAVLGITYYAKFPPFWNWVGIGILVLAWALTALSGVFKPGFNRRLKKSN